MAGDITCVFSSPLTSRCIFCNSLLESFTEVLGDAVLMLDPALMLWCSDTGLDSLLLDLDISDPALRLPCNPVVSRFALGCNDVGI